MQTITIQEYQQRLENGEKIHLLDVREDDEVAAGHLGGLHLPLGQVLSMMTDDIEDWKDEEIVIHCRAGHRSLQAALMLETMGFTNVKNLEGGIQAWQAAGGEVQGGGKVI